MCNTSTDASRRRSPQECPMAPLYDLASALPYGPGTIDRRGPGTGGA